VLRKVIKAVGKILMVAIGLGLVLVVIPRLITSLFAPLHTYTIQNVPAAPVAIVFGAGLWRDGSPTTVLRDRLSTATELYFSGKVQKILLSGDNSYLYYNEPGAMRQYVLTLGVPEEAMVLDYAGRRTYDTCYRAGSIFGIQRAILVTQGFHLPRALYTCNALGLEVYGVPSDRRTYSLRSVIWWNLRELPATLTALIQVHFTHPLPILGQPEPIFPIGTQ
jgi:SanA protein